MNRLPLLLFFALALLQLWGIVTANSTLIYSTKPCLMPALALWLALSTHGRSAYSFLRRTVLGALIFSTLGDVLLMFEGQIFFLLGLIFFLLAHLSYIGAFSAVSNVKTGFLTQKPWWALPFLALPLWLLWTLWSGIPTGLRLPVAIYAVVISTMALSVLHLKGRIMEGIFWPLLAGAVLFLASDSLLATHLFGSPFGGDRLAIMVTYMGGQFLLVQGAIEILKRMEKV